MVEYLDKSKKAPVFTEAIRKRFRQVLNVIASAQKGSNNSCLPNHFNTFGLHNLCSITFFGIQDQFETTISLPSDRLNEYVPESSSYFKTDTPFLMVSPL